MLCHLGEMSGAIASTNMWCSNGHCTEIALMEHLGWCGLEVQAGLTEVTSHLVSRPCSCVHCLGGRGI